MIVISKTSGEQTTEDWHPFSQGTHRKGVTSSKVEVKFHNQLEKECAFILLSD